MKCYNFRIPCEGRGDVFSIIPMGCVHLGNDNSEKEKFKNMVDYIKNKEKTYWVGMGDYCDFINYKDKRFDPGTIDQKYSIKSLKTLHQEETKEMAEILKPIANKCIGLVEGNHEQTIDRDYLFNPVDYLATELNTVNLSYISIVSLLFDRGSHSTRGVDIFLWHGDGSVANDGGALNKVMRLESKFDADIYLMAHVHRKVCGTRIKHFKTRSKVPLLLQKKKLFGVTGTFLSTYQQDKKSYGEKPAYDPTPIGVLKITIEPFVKQRIGNRKSIELPPNMHISE